MNDNIWHVDGAFLSLVDKPLAVIGILFCVMVLVTALMVVRSPGNTNDD